MSEENETENQEETAAAAAPEASQAPLSEGNVSVENLRVLENIEVALSVVVGNAEIRIRDLLRLNEGSVVELTGWPVTRLIFSPMAP